MKKIYIKTLIVTLVSAPIIATGTYLGVSIYKKRNQEMRTDLNTHKDLVEFNSGENINIFPKLNQSIFYDFLVLENQKPIITQKLIANVIKFVVPRINTTNDNVHWSYKLSEDKSQCLFYFEVQEDGEIYNKEYLFNVKSIM